MGRRYLDGSVYDESIRRIRSVMEEGHRLVVSFSGGKDSGVLLELTVEAARQAGRLPVDVVMRDEEIMLPGTFEYCERVANRTSEVTFNWLIAHQPIINTFNRYEPYWWVFDPYLDPSEWVRQPPDFAEHITDLNIEAMITADRFPPGDGYDLINLIGLRGAESRGRMYGVYSSGGWLTKLDPRGYRKGRPIYDWNDGDVWREIRDRKWDYNTAYDAMYRLGMSRKNLRIAPPTMRPASLESLQVGAKAWPQWFDKVAKRCPGTRQAVMFGRRAVEPRRNHGESWEDTFVRTCIEDAPEWIAERARKTAYTAVKRHGAHSTEPLPQVTPCKRCPALGSWEVLAKGLYMGDCFSFTTDLPQIEPEFFRPGAGVWGGSAAFA